MSKRRTAWITAGIGVLLLGALLTALVVDPPGLIGKKRTTEEQTAEQNEAPPSESSEVIVFTPVYEGIELRFAQHLETPGKSVDPKLFAVNRFLDEVQDVFPNLKAQAIELNGSTAKLNLEGPLSSGYSSMEEALLINGVLAALGQFPDVERVEIMLNEKSIQSLGSLDLSSPMAVIRPADVADDPS